MCSIPKVTWYGHVEYIVYSQAICTVNSSNSHLDFPKFDNGQYFLIFQNGEKINAVKEHKHQINDLQLSLDMTMLISASKDTSAKVCI